MLGIQSEAKLYYCTLFSDKFIEIWEISKIFSDVRIFPQKDTSKNFHLDGKTVPSQKLTDILGIY